MITNHDVTSKKLPSFNILMSVLLDNFLFLIQLFMLHKKIICTHHSSRKQSCSVYLLLMANLLTCTTYCTQYLLSIINKVVHQTIYTVMLSASRQFTRCKYQQHTHTKYTLKYRDKTKKQLVALFAVCEPQKETNFNHS